MQWFIDRYKIFTICNAFVFKILAIHNPNLYFVNNGKSEQTISKYGVELPEMNDGKRYKVTARLLKELCDETCIKDLAGLDYYLYLENQN